MSDPLPLSAEERVAIRKSTGMYFCALSDTLEIRRYEATCAALEARVVQLEGELAALKTPNEEVIEIDEDGNVHATPRQTAWLDSLKAQQS